MNRDKNTTENIAITLIRFCVPLILSSILQQLYNWVDAFIVGNTMGEKALASIGSTGTLPSFLCKEMDIGLLRFERGASFRNSSYDPIQHHFTWRAHITKFHE